MKQHRRETRSGSGESIGIALGDQFSRYYVLDETGTVVEAGAFRNQPASIAKHFGGGFPVA